VATTLRTAGIAELVTAIRAVVRPDTAPARASEQVAAMLAPMLARDDLVPVRCTQPDRERYRQHILHVEQDGSFSIVSLVWLPGQSTVIHDHVSWCVVGVWRGAEFETRYQLDPHGRYLKPTSTCVNEAGAVAHLTPPGDIHRVANASTGRVVSIHVYGADIAALGSSIRREYHQPVRA
jgi:3-mercaptopropionate dioxygenase